MSLIDRIHAHARARAIRRAQQQLEACVEAARNAPATVQYRQRRAAALKATRS